MTRVALGLIVCLTLPAVSRAASIDISGKWALNFVERDGTHTIGACTFRQSGQTLAGSCGPDNGAPVPLSGSVDGDRVKWRVSFRPTDGADVPMEFTALVSDAGSFMRGTYTLNGEGVFTASKVE